MAQLRLFLGNVSTAGGVSSGALASAGATTVSFVGESTRAGALSSAGVATVSAVGRSTAAGALSASGVATVSAVGRATVSGALGVSGIGSVAFSGESTVAGVLNSAGQATTALVGSSSAPSVQEGAFAIEGSSDFSAVGDYDFTAPLAPVYQYRMVAPIVAYAVAQIRPVAVIDVVVNQTPAIAASIPEPSPAVQFYESINAVSVASPEELVFIR